MLKKVVSLSFIFITLFYLYIGDIHAYEYKNPENEQGVEDLINEIYLVKDQYIELFGSDEEDDIDLINGSSTFYWWPIGSIEEAKSGGKIYAQGDPETVTITSRFGKRNDPFTGEIKGHPALDIAGGRGEGKVNIIAAKDGIVVYPTSLEGNNCPSSHSTSSCGGGYGNYVIIQHPDGNYTLYAHLYENSILVKSGDSVKQGQVIAKMGTSGNSTGAHLHFEIRIGQNSRSATVDPLEYVDPKNPRPASSGELLEFLGFLEGTTGVVGDSYKVVDIGDKVRTVGHGVTLENNSQRFAKYGIKISDYPVGSLISIQTVDQIQTEILNESRTYIEGDLAKKSISLASYKIDALIVLRYQAGNIDGFTKAYEKYGETNALYENWWVHKGKSSGFDLTRRRSLEWKLFTTGEYTTG